MLLSHWLISLRVDVALLAARPNWGAFGHLTGSRKQHPAFAQTPSPDVVSHVAVDKVAGE